MNITRNASPRPSTVNEEARTVELVIATEADCNDGLVLSCRSLPDHGPAAVPVLLTHRNETGAMAGRIRSLRVEARQVIGLAEFIDAPAAEEGWRLARSGCAVSVGASIAPDALQRQRNGPDLATRWRINEASLVPVGADPNALTRSLSLPESNPMTTDTSSNTLDTNEATETDEEITVSRSEMKRQRDIARLVNDAKLESDVAEELIRSGKTISECSRIVVRELRIKSDGYDRFAPDAPLSHGRGYQWAPGTAPTASAGTEGEPADPLARAIHRAVRGQALERPLVDELKAAGYSGKGGEEVARNAFVTGKRSQLLRGFHSTSDAPALLLETGDRLLQERHNESPRGILELARIRPLSDFREVSTVDAGLVGSAVQMGEGAELRYGSLESDAGKYKPSRYGLGLSFSFEALKNDDLGGIPSVLQEVSQTMLESESNTLGTLLHGPGTLGGVCPDGLALFHADHNNKPGTTSAMTAAGVGAMVQLLRGQTSVGGRKLWIEPGYLLVGPDLETDALQLFTETWNADAATSTNPWKNLKLIVDPTVPATFFYLAASGSRKPFELGRVDGMPRMQQQEDFDTSAMKMKVEHAYGAACVDHRVIVRNK